MRHLLPSSNVIEKKNTDHHPIVLTNTNSNQIGDSLKDLCAKGPSFIPTPENFDWLQLQKDFDAFRNRVRARYLFSSSEGPRPNDETQILKRQPKQPSNWRSTKTNCPELETFLSSVERALFNDTSRRKVPDNLTKEERSSLRQWRKNELFNQDGELLMRLQDKGNRFVIVDKETDKRKAEEQIARSSFQKLDHDPTSEHIQKVKEWADKWHNEGEITSEWKEFIVNENAKPGKNSTLYKTHKEGNPVRLLTSGCNTAIENLSRFIEIVCAPFTENLRSRIKNTGHLLDIIDELNEQGFPEDTVLVSFDIVNMYPSIDNVNGIQAVAKFLNTRVEKNPSTECIIEGLSLCLYNNNSQFAMENLLQVNGTATGAPNSCSYADIAIAPIDDAVFQKMQSDFKELRYFGRYRDDCLSLWCGSRDRLQQFFSFLNSLSNDLKFTMEIGEQSLCFLDVEIKLEDGKLQTTVYSKPTDAHIYLHANSCHNEKSKKGIPKGVALRLKRICSTDAEYETKSNEYKNYLVKRGYNVNMVNDAFDSLRNKSRSDARKKVGREQKSRVIFATNFNPRGPDVTSIIKKNLNIIENAPELQTLFPRGTIMVANKKENNLKNLLMRSDPYGVKPDLLDKDIRGYSKCHKTSCDSCQNYVVSTSSIVCAATGRHYQIRSSSTCTTKCVVYVIVCKTCGKQGVGSTVSWKPRLSNYKSHIKNRVETCRIVKHFLNDCVDENLNNFYFIIVDVVNNIENLNKQELENILLSKEKFWIGTLVTQHKGLNGTHDWSRIKRTEREK